MAKARHRSATLLVWAVLALVLGLGAGLGLGQLGCDRRATPKPKPAAPKVPAKGTARPTHHDDDREPVDALPEAKPVPKSPTKATPPAKGEPVPLTHPVVPPVSDAKPLPRFAFVIDDLGYVDPALVARLLRLNVPFTVAVLPYQEHTRLHADMAFKAGKEVILHLPMEGRAEKDPGRDALLYDLGEAELRARARKAMADVPHIVGTNNHMGSRLTSDRTRITWVLQEVKAKGIWFMDSRTSAQTVAHTVATELGIKAASRKVFIDDDKAFEAIQKEWERALAIAERDGEVIAIGHIYPETVEALEKLVPLLKGRVQFVAAGALVK